MTEFWKSNPKKFCDFCKVWFADNKSSVDFHERGKKHQESVQRKLGDMRKKGLKQHEEQQHKNNFLKQMEEDALKAFKKDAEKDNTLVGQYNQAAVEFKVRQFEEEAENERRPTKQQQQGTWYEGKNKDGCVYYWNDLTGVSKWEAPADFVAYEEKSSTAADEKEKKTKPDKEKKEEKESGNEKKDDEGSGDEKKDDEGSGDEKKDDEGSGDEKKGEEGNVTRKVRGETEQGEPSHQGQKRKGDAYGQWTQVVDEEDSTPVDLQLPESAKNYMSHYQPQVEQRQPVEEFEFGIKTIPSIATSSEEKVGFKKRKMKGGGRSIRQREVT